MSAWSVLGFAYWLVSALFWFGLKIDLTFKSPLVTHIVCGPTYWTFRGLMEGFLDTERSEKKDSSAGKTQ